MKSLFLLIFLGSILGCSEGYDDKHKPSNIDGINKLPPDGIYKEENGFEYVLTCIENVQFIAYRSPHGYWEITSTGKECNKNGL